MYYMELINNESINQSIYFDEYVFEMTVSKAR